jgi:hypothetical protein
MNIRIVKLLVVQYYVESSELSEQYTEGVKVLTFLKQISTG